MWRGRPSAIYWPGVIVQTMSRSIARRVLIVCAPAPQSPFHHSQQAVLSPAGPQGFHQTTALKRLVCLGAGGQ